MSSLKILLSVREARGVVLQAGMMSFGITDWGDLFALCSKESCSKQSHFDAVFESNPLQKFAFCSSTDLASTGNRDARTRETA